MTLREKLKELSGLGEGHTFREHINAIQTGENVPVDGEIVLYRNQWHTVAIYRENATVKEYFVDGLASKYSVDASEIIERISMWDEANNKWISFIPDFTDISDSANFLLVNGEDMQGFFVKTKDYTLDEPLSLTWSSS
jgi:hypothetical protein